MPGLGPWAVAVSYRIGPFPAWLPVALGFFGGAVPVAGLTGAVLSGAQLPPPLSPGGAVVLLVAGLGSALAQVGILAGWLVGRRW